MYLPLAELFQFVITVSKKYDIDESHSLGHSMRVLQFSEQIAREESRWVHAPIPHKPIIQAAAILHDTCDRKYRDEEPALREVGDFLSRWMTDSDVNATVGIIGQMSYSKIMKTGMPDMLEYQSAFNIVREADLLDAYDFDRSMLFHMHHNRESLSNAYANACELFETRVLKHKEHGLLLTRYSQAEHQRLSEIAVKRMYHWKRTFKNTG